MWCLSAAGRVRFPKRPLRIDVDEAQGVATEGRRALALDWAGGQRLLLGGRAQLDSLLQQCKDLF